MSSSSSSNSVLSSTTSNSLLYNGSVVGETDDNSYIKFTFDKNAKALPDSLLLYLTIVTVEEKFYNSIAAITVTDKDLKHHYSLTGTQYKAFLMLCDKASYIDKFNGYVSAKIPTFLFQHVKRILGFANVDEVWMTVLFHKGSTAIAPLEKSSSLYAPHTLQWFRKTSAIPESTCNIGVSDMVYGTIKWSPNTPTQDLVMDLTAALAPTTNIASTTTAAANTVDIKSNGSVVNGVKVHQVLVHDPAFKLSNVFSVIKASLLVDGKSVMSYDSGFAMMCFDRLAADQTNNVAKIPMWTLTLAAWNNPAECLVIQKGQHVHLKLTVQCMNDMAAKQVRDYEQPYNAWAIVSTV